MNWAMAKVASRAVPPLGPFGAAPSVFSDEGPPVPPVPDTSAPPVSSTYSERERRDSLSSVVQASRPLRDGTAGSYCVPVYGRTGHPAPIATITSPGPGGRRSMVRIGGSPDPKAVATHYVITAPRGLASWPGPVRLAQAPVGRGDDAAVVPGEALPHRHLSGSSKTNLRQARSCR